ncbi:MAG TPA: carbohydrate ABC transporter permease [Acholeplasma sp.]|nr:carbohydrate ABC transporter permease [Acholeplasma sp.]
MKKVLTFIKKYYVEIIILIFLSILLVMSFYPLVMLFFKSFKEISDDQQNPFGIPKVWSFVNYEYAWLVIKPYFINSILITAFQTIGIVVLGSITAFPFTRYNFPYKNVIFYGIISLMMIPGLVTLTSQYELINNIKLVNSIWGVILPSIAGSIPFALFLLNMSFKNVSKDLMDAAEIDGASDFQVFRHIMMPLSKPIVWTLVITSFMNSWNDYLWPSLVLLEDDKKTLPLALVNFTNSYYDLTGGYGAPFAAYIISSLPLIILFLVASKQFIQGLTSGSIKM